MRLSVPDAHLYICVLEMAVTGQDRWLEADAEYAPAQAQSCSASAKLHAPPATVMTGTAKRFIPFSDGPRDCIGRTLAQMNITAALAALLANFTFSLAASVREVI